MRPNDCHHSDVEQILQHGSFVLISRLLTEYISNASDKKPFLLVIWKRKIFSKIVFLKAILYTTLVKLESLKYYLKY